MAVGLDFGTTNSSIALAGPNGVQIANFASSGGVTEAFRSLLYLHRIRESGRSAIKSWSGPAGIDEYLNSDEKGRLVQSLKSFLTSRSLQTTEVFGRRFKLEELIARILADIRAGAERQFGPTATHVVVGRPVRFVGAESDADDEYALGRLKEALLIAGFREVRFEYEPVGAAYHYESTLDHDELVMIGDFGGGTSDFSLLRVGPSLRRSGVTRQVIGNEGVGIAGDSFDARIIRHLVSPALGAGSELESGGKRLPVPNWVYFKLERWHHLSFLKSAETISMLKSVAGQALEPKKIEALLYLIQHDLGYQLHRAVQRAKIALSNVDRTRLHFSDGEAEIDEELTRADFESWIQEELTAIENHVDELLSKTGTHPADVDVVFLTGGSSFVPAVRRIFESRFGHHKIRTCDEFTSVARGLALRALELR
ncbi:MAG: Hsp70 family protein [Acidobacteriaceae bacterium]|nr:Hsp70 family protein [Acidobacteriaceae bacterium]